MGNRPIRLSGRLLAIADLCAAAGEGAPYVLCDVGCDHAHVPIRLLQEEKIRAAILLDVLPGPLQKAAENLARYQMTERCRLLLSDGLDEYSPKDAQVLLISGLGGMLIADILLRDPGKTKSFQHIVVQPQSEQAAARRALRELGFFISNERLVAEEGKYYPVILAGREKEETAPDSGGEYGELGLYYGPVLLARKDRILQQYLSRGLTKAMQILSQLPEKESEKRREVEEELSRIRKAMQITAESADTQKQGRRKSL
ncbi:MAG: SAM-dependent methyltransferase [Lachnospiraceae bacterium]|nr:SAM-dependent methyltransferase [Lachnospiraceae bacterium]